MERTEDFKTPECRLSYASGLFKARSQEQGKPPKFGATLIFPKSARAEIEKRIADLIKKQWGDKALEMAKAGLIKSPFLAGDGKEARSKKTGEIQPGLGPDVFFVRPSANHDRPPAVIWKNPNQQETETNVYSGCYGKAVVNLFCWDNPKQGKGVSMGIQMFQKLREGERLGGSGGVAPEKWAEAVPDEGAAPDSTTSGEGAGGSEMWVEVVLDEGAAPESTTSGEGAGGLFGA
jgi:hypothetical protein